MFLITRDDVDVSVASAERSVVARVRVEPSAATETIEYVPLFAVLVAPVRVMVSDACHPVNVPAMPEITPDAAVIVIGFASVGATDAVWKSMREPCL